MDQNLFLQQLYMSLTHNALPHICCYWYHKGKTFQANHNLKKRFCCSSSVVIDTTKVRLFKQITTITIIENQLISCYWYHKGKTFQANHNQILYLLWVWKVVIDTTKVRLFKQITTGLGYSLDFLSCYWYHKGKTFQANHNSLLTSYYVVLVVIDTTKVRLFKQITTLKYPHLTYFKLLLIPQR